MDLRLSPEQQLLVDAARGFLARACPPTLVRTLERDARGYDLGLWREMARLGWLRGDVGDAGTSLLDIALLLEQMGRVLLPGPFIHSVVLAAPVLARLPSAGVLLDAIATGERVATIGILEPGDRDEWQPATLRARAAATGAVLDGCKRLVAYAEHADLMVLSARRDEGAVVVVTERREPGVSCIRRDTFGGEPLYDVTFREVPVPHGRIVASGPSAEEAIESMRARAIVAWLAFMVGAAERVLEMTVEYATTRTQFGRPIGSFQAVAHRCADMRSDIDALRLLVYQAAWCVGQEGHGMLAVSAAKAYGNEALRRIFTHAHQVHGAIGFSTEHDLHLFTRRAKAVELLWGSTASHLERVATAMGL